MANQPYWADFRRVTSLTVEDILGSHRLDHIDILKLDCEGSEFSILGNTTSLDRIGLIVGEYHGRERFLKLVADRFADWKLRILKDGELGTFWLQSIHDEENATERVGAPAGRNQSRVGQVFAAHRKPPGRQSRTHRSDDGAHQDREHILVGREDLAHPTNFWLQKPQQETKAVPRAAAAKPVTSEPAKVPSRAFNAPSGHTSLPPLLIAALRDTDGPRYDLLLMDKGMVIARYEHPKGWLRGFARLDGRLWTIDSKGTLYTIEFSGMSLQLQEVSNSPLAWEAHDLAAIGRKLVTAGSTHNAVVLYDPQSDRWEVKRPWIPVNGKGISEKGTGSDHDDRCLSPFRDPRDPDDDGPSPNEGDRHHLNSIAHDGKRFILSMFTSDPKPAGVHWRDSNLDQGLIVRWGADGFDDEPLAVGVYAPHSLRIHDSHVWWCDSFRAAVCRDDGWRSPNLGGFARGLRFVDGQCVVGLSKSRVAPNPQLDTCGVCVFDPRKPESICLYEVESPYFEIYDVLPVPEWDVENSKTGSGKRTRQQKTGPRTSSDDPVDAVSTSEIVPGIRETVMKVTDCECQGPGWCERHQCYKDEYGFRCCRRSRKLFLAWERGVGPGQNTVRRTPRTVQEQRCKRLGKTLREQTCPTCRGDVRLKVFWCEVHEECTLARELEGLACCCLCDDYQAGSSDESANEDDVSEAEPRVAT